MFDGIVPITKREFLEILRNPLYISLAVIVPLITVFLFATGFTLDVENLRLCVVDRDRTKESRDYISSYVNSRYFKLLAYKNSFLEAEDLINSAKVSCILIIPENFAKRLAQGRRSEACVIIDGTFPNRGVVAKTYIEAINRNFSQRYSKRFFEKRGKEIENLIDTEVRVWFNPALKSKNFIIPGLIVTTLMFYPALISSIAITREKELGSILNIYTSPITPSQFIIGKAIPYIAISFFDLFAILFMNRFLFHVNISGNPFLLIFASFLYICATVGIGLFISTLCNTQSASMIASAIATVIPAFLYSGFIVPVYTMEKSAIIQAHLFPSLYFMRIVRGIYLKGVGFSVLYREFLALFAYTFLIYLFSIKRFKKRLF